MICASIIDITAYHRIHNEDNSSKHNDSHLLISLLLSRMHYMIDSCPKAGLVTVNIGKFP